MKTFERDSITVTQNSAHITSNSTLARQVARTVSHAQKESLGCASRAGCARERAWAKIVSSPLTINCTRDLDSRFSSRCRETIRHEKKRTEDTDNVKI